MVTYRRYQGVKCAVWRIVRCGTRMWRRRRRTAPEEKSVKTAIGAARAKLARDKML